MQIINSVLIQGNIGVWYKQVGDKVQPGDVLCSIETDKATIDFEMQDEGYVAKIFYDAGTKDIPLGEVLAVLTEEESDVGAFKDMVVEGGAATATPAAEAAPVQ